MDVTPEKSHGVVVRFLDPGPGRRILNFITPFVYLQVQLWKVVGPSHAGYARYE